MAGAAAGHAPSEPYPVHASRQSPVQLFQLVFIHVLWWDTSDEDSIGLRQLVVVRVDQVLVSNDQPIPHLAPDQIQNPNCLQLAKSYRTVPCRLTNEDPIEHQMCPVPLLMARRNVAEGELVQPSLALHALAGRIDRQEHDPRDEPDGDQGLRHHREEAHKDVGVDPVLLENLVRVRCALSAVHRDCSIGVCTDPSGWSIVARANAFPEALPAHPSQEYMSAAHI